MDSLEALSPIDGRYRRHTKDLSNIFSEKGLMEHRLIVEGEYLIYLSDHPQIQTRNFSSEEKKTIRNLYELSLEDAQIVKDIETKGYKNIKKTNHDVKAIEYFMKEKLRGTSLEDSLEWIHFALTSEDTNNLAYALMLGTGLDKVIIPKLEDIYFNLSRIAIDCNSLPMLSRTHGQSASPTTFGKEFKVFSSRLERQLDQLRGYKILAKINGATGNYNAHNIAYPDVNCLEFSKHFIESFNNEHRIVKLEPNLITTQIEPHDTYAELFDNLKRINNILIDFDQDMWRYISDDWIKQKTKEGEVGSSTMPHKVNPIDFENSEGNLGMANAMFEFFSRKLPISRLQRDLSDSTVERNFGVVLGHSLIAYNSLLNGLTKIEINEEKVIQVLEEHPEVISEAIQTVLRREGAEMPYEQLKELTRGKKVTMDDFGRFIDGLQVDERIKEELRKITPTKYTGMAQFLVHL